MNCYIKCIRLKNYRRFVDATIALNSSMNLFVGDNATGKSTLLQAINLAMSGSDTRVMAFGMENILNAKVVQQWLKAPSAKTLPQCIVELVFAMPNEPKFNVFHGEQHHLGIRYNQEFGIKMVCEPNPNCSCELEAAICNRQGKVFPFEFYIVSFSTFRGDAYSGFKKPVKSIFLDNSTINTAKALKHVIVSTYQAVVGDRERLTAEYDFSNHLNQFPLPQSAREKSLVVSADLENLLDIREKGVSLANQGEGVINLCKTESALARGPGDESIVLVEEPENHLSPIGLRKLVSMVQERMVGCQIFIATHSSYITARLGLQQALLLGEGVKSLAGLTADTASFFMKAPNDNLLQFVLSKRVLLVEGAAEFILMENFIRQITGRGASALGVWILSLNNLSFKRYFEVGKALGIRIAAVRDNDGHPQNWYPEWTGDTIQVFSDSDANRNTFEVCLFQDNRTVLSELFDNHNDVLNYMLQHKAEAAFQILQSNRTMNVPTYIQKAIRWVME